MAITVYYHDANGRKLLKYIRIMDNTGSGAQMELYRMYLDKSHYIEVEVSDVSAN